MPGEPRAGQSPSAVGGHPRAAKEMRLRVQESKEPGGVEARTGRKDLASSPLGPAHLAQISRTPAALFRPQLARKELGKTHESLFQGDLRGAAPGSPSRPIFRLRAACKARQWERGTCRVSLPMRSPTPLPPRTAGFPHRPGRTNSTYRPGLSARSTDLQGAGRGGGDPRACRGHSREGEGEAPEEGPDSGPPEQTGASARPSSPGQSPWLALPGPAQPALRRGLRVVPRPPPLTWAGSPEPADAAAPPSLRKRL